MRLFTSLPIFSLSILFPVFHFQSEDKHDRDNRIEAYIPIYRLQRDEIARMMYEIYKQLQGKADKRQVKNPKLGLAHNLGGNAGMGIASCVGGWEVGLTATTWDRERASIPIFR